MEFSYFLVDGIAANNLPHRNGYRLARSALEDMEQLMSGLTLGIDHPHALRGECDRQVNVAGKVVSSRVEQGEVDTLNPKHNSSERSRVLSEEGYYVLRYQAVMLVPDSQSETVMGYLAQTGSASTSISFEADAFRCSDCDHRECPGAYGVESCDKKLLTNEVHRATDMFEHSLVMIPAIREAVSTVSQISQEEAQEMLGSDIKRAKTKLSLHSSMPPLQLKAQSEHKSVHKGLCLSLEYKKENRYRFLTQKQDQVHNCTNENHEETVKPMAEDIEQLRKRVAELEARDATREEEVKRIKQQAAEESERIKQQAAEDKKALELKNLLLQKFNTLRNKFIEAADQGRAAAPILARELFSHGNPEGEAAQIEKYQKGEDGFLFYEADKELYVSLSKLAKLSQGLPLQRSLNPNLLGTLDAVTGDGSPYRSIPTKLKENSLNAVASGD